MMALARLLLAGATLLATVAIASPARAVYQCGPATDECQCAMNNPYPCCENGGNCTWWAWHQACCKWAAGLPGWGNANQWAGNAKAHPSYKVVSYPVVGSIAVRVAGTYGHVAWVTAVSGSNVTVTEMSCWGNWGSNSATRDKSYYDGGFIVRNEQCECQPGQTQTETCGKCGERKRSCNTSCQWGSWSDCAGQGSCLPGETEQQACGDCGVQTRTCGSDCSFGELGACEADPSFVAKECSTGQPGECDQGIEQCAAGVRSCQPLAEPTAELCDGLDNDCDGEADEGVCWQDGKTGSGGTKVPPESDNTTAADPDAEEPGEMVGSCGCVVGRKTRSRGHALLLGLFALALGARVTRRRSAPPRAARPSRSRAVG